MKWSRLVVTLFVAGLFFGGCLAFARIAALQEMLWDGIVLPIMYMLWLGRLVLRSFDSGTQWLIGITIILFILGWGLYRVWPERIQLAGRLHQPDNKDYAPLGKIEYWQVKINSLKTQGIGSDYAAFEFRRLARRIQEFSGRTPLPGPRAGKESKTSDASLVEPFIAVRRSPIVHLPERQRGWRRIFSKRQPTPGPEIDQSLDALCNYLETQLEIHDDSDS